MRHVFRRIKITQVILVLFTIGLSSCASYQLDNIASNIEVSFTPQASWVERDFKSSTDYILKQNVLMATSSDSASLLYRKIRINLNETPFINWRWKVSNVLSENHHETEQNGDDFPARVYIAIKPDLGEIKPRALTYVWASNLQQFSSWPNPYSNKVNMIALESGDEHAKKWIYEKRNLKQDLSSLFNMDIQYVDGIALMTDTDNTHGYVSAEYADLFFSRQ